MPTFTIHCSFGTLIASVLLLSDAATQDIFRASVDSSGAQGSADSGEPSERNGMVISANGSVVAFISRAPNLVWNDQPTGPDVFVYDVLTGQTSCASVDLFGVPTQRNGYAGLSLSADGRHLAFASWASNLVPNDTNGQVDLFVRDLAAGVTRRVSVDSAGVQGNLGIQPGASLSADGQVVAFSSHATNLVAGDVNGSRDVFVHDLGTGQTTLVSRSSAGVPGDSWSEWPWISGDGRLVVFASASRNLVPNDQNNRADVFLHDRTTGQTRLLSMNARGGQANSNCEYPVLSADGNVVAFQSNADNLVPGDSDNAMDVFAHDLRTGITRCISVDSAGGRITQGCRMGGAMSTGGRLIPFESLSGNLVAFDSNQNWDCFVHDLLTGQTRRVSIGSLGRQGNADSRAPALDADGRHVVFASDADNFVPHDTNRRTDVFLADTAGSAFELLSSGTCPGARNLLVRGATVRSKVVLMHGVAGTTVVASPPCAGLVLGVASPLRARLLVTDYLGQAGQALLVPPGTCGTTVQAVDAFTCRATNVIVL